MVAWVPLIASVVGSVAGGAMSANATNKAAKSSSDANAQALQFQRDALDYAARVNAPMIGARDTAMRAIYEGQGFDPSSYVAPAEYGFQSGTGGSGLAPYIPKYGEAGYKAPATDGMGMPSPSAALGHNSSIFTALKSGEVNDKNWWADGGPSVAGGISQQIGKRLGLPTGSEILSKVFSDGSDKARWSYAQDNAKKLDPTIDYEGYYNANKDNLWAIGKYMPGALKGYDFNGDGKLDSAEHGAFEIHSGVRGGPQGDIVYYPKEGDLAATGAAAASATTTAPKAVDPLAGFRKSGWHQVATQNFMDDAERMSAAGAGGGTLMSGAMLKALTDRSQQRSYSGFGDYMGQNNAIAGLGQTSASQQLGASSNFASAGSQSAINNGNIWANAATQNANNSQNTLQNILYGIGKYGGWGGSA